MIESARYTKLTLKADKTHITDLANSFPNKKYINSFFCYDLLTGHGTVGIAYLGEACDKTGYAVNINEYYSESNSELKSARTFVHEIGHNVGM